MQHFFKYDTRFPFIQSLSTTKSLLQFIILKLFPNLKCLTKVQYFDNPIVHDIRFVRVISTI